MSYYRLQNGDASRFEQLVMTSVRDIGHGATFVQICKKAEELGDLKEPINFTKVELTLFRLDSLGYTYSWFADPERFGKWGKAKDRCFRLQNKGLRLLEEAEEEAGPERLQGGFGLWNFLFGSRG
jgi:hypothetical protein